MTPRHLVVAGIAGGLLPAFLWLLSGCNIVTPIAYAIEGPGTIEAELELEDRPTVVFVDDRGNLLSPITLRRDIADKASKELMKRGGLSVTIRPADAMAIARNLDTNNEPIAIDRIAREVGAEQIIYVQVLNWARTPDGFTPRPTSTVSVQVIDAVNGSILYPPESRGTGAQMQGRTVQTLLEPMQDTTMTSPAAMRQVQQALALETGVEISKLFYEHERVPLGQNLNPR